MDLSEQLVPTNMLPAKSPTHSPTHEQHLSQHRERKRKNPAPEKVDASAEKYLEVSREEPPDDDMIVPVSSGMAFPVSNGYMPFRDMGGHPDDIIDIDEDEDMEDEDMEDEEDELAEADEEEEPEEFELPAPIKQQHRPGPGRPPGVKNGLTAKPRKSYYIPTGRPRGRPPRNSGERSVDRSVERRPPGRPRVNPPKDGPKRPRGRPRIHPLKDESEKRPRGRPISNPKYLSLVRTNQILEERISNLMDQVESKDKEIRLLRRKLSETGVDVDSVGYETDSDSEDSEIVFKTSKPVNISPWKTFSIRVVLKVPTPEKRPQGRPCKSPSAPPGVKRKPGRPRTKPESPPKEKRPRGRPRIHPIKPKSNRPRGRPRKITDLFTQVKLVNGACSSPNPSVSQSQGVRQAWAQVVPSSDICNTTDQ